MTSLFEVYDPYTFYLGLSLNWSFIVFVLLFLFLDFTTLKSSNFFLLMKMMKTLMFEFGVLFSNTKMKASMMILFMCLFLFIFLVNLLGLIPYVFSLSSQFSFTLSLSFPFWVSFFLLGIVKFNFSFFVHLVPLGTPVSLVPVMVIIETVSLLIRPWSLSVRLMANMISGHLLMSLLGDCGVILLVVQLFLFLFEVCVCFIQSYVFSVLLTLYSSEI